MIDCVSVCVFEIEKRGERDSVCKRVREIVCGERRRVSVGVLLLFDPEKPFQVFFPLLCIILRLTSAAAEKREREREREAKTSI